MSGKKKAFLVLDILFPIDFVWLLCLAVWFESLHNIEIPFFNINSLIFNYMVRRVFNKQTISISTVYLWTNT